MLKKLSNFPGIKGPVVTIVMDGFGITDKVEGNAIKAARTPTLDNLFKMYPNVLLKAHGPALSAIHFPLRSKCPGKTRK